MRELTWSVRRRLYYLLKSSSSTTVCVSPKYPSVRGQPVRCFQHGTAYQQKKQQMMSSKEARSLFIDYFKERDHLYVHSSTVLPKKNEGTYFINAGMNQFKPIFLGSVVPDSEMASYKKVVNSQKCIRVGGKHNDLPTVGNDTFHHTFFEMLGSWSFGQYFKKEACEMAWNLLTEGYGLPRERLYVTYFGGNAALLLEPDLECRDIWLQIGVPAERVLPFGMPDNFWDMGFAGPCGPCTEIHYDHHGNRDASTLVNAGVPDVIELWNLVFMQFDRQIDGSLESLPEKHVDTGMGLERLSAVLQGKMSNYDSDLFLPIFTAIHKNFGCPAYGGKIGTEDAKGIDRAYRIVADHARMFTVAIGDGLLPGRKDLHNQLRQIIMRCVKQASSVLVAPPGGVASLVPVVLESLGDAFPELASSQNNIIDVVNHTEQRYLERAEVVKRMLKKAVNDYNTSTFTGQQMYQVYDGQFGDRSKMLSADILLDIANDIGISVDVQAFNNIMDQKSMDQQPINIEKVADFLTHRDLNQLDLSQMEKMGIPATDDSYKYQYSNTGGEYAFPSLPGDTRVVGLMHDGKFVDNVSAGRKCGVLLDKTAFYAEMGGQSADLGKIYTLQGNEFAVTSVQLMKNYVLHKGQVKSGQFSVGDNVQTSLDQEHRVQCMCNHTATHLLNHALSRVLGHVSQRGSSVTRDRLTFQFSCIKNNISHDDIEEVSRIVNEKVEQGLPVYTTEVPYNEAMKIQGISTLQDEVYPKVVRVISVGCRPEDLIANPNRKDGYETSIELCGGTHVLNTTDIGPVVVTNFQGLKQGIRSVTAITGSEARTVLDHGEEVQREMDALMEQIDNKSNLRVIWQEEWAERAQRIKKLLSGERVLPVLVRKKVQRTLERVQRDVLSERLNRAKKDALVLKLDEVVRTHQQDLSIVTTLPFAQTRDMVRVLLHCEADKPVMVLCRSEDSGVGVCYVPKDYGGFVNVQNWAEHVAQFKKGNHHAPKGKKFAKVHKMIWVVKFPIKRHHDMVQAADLAQTYIDLYTL